MGNQTLRVQSNEKSCYAVFKKLFAELPRTQIILDMNISDDRPRDKVGKHEEVAQKIRKTGFFSNFLSVYIDQITDTVKSEETDPKWRDLGNRRSVPAEKRHFLQIGNETGEVIKKPIEIFVTDQC